MVETEIHLTEQERDALQEISRRTGKSEGELIHEAICTLIAQFQDKFEDVAYADVNWGEVINAGKAANIGRVALEQIFQNQAFQRWVKQICEDCAKHVDVDSDNMEQEVYEEILKKIGQYDSKLGFIDWVSRIIYNVLVDLTLKDIRYPLMQKAKGIWKDRQDLPSPEDLRREWNRF